MTLYAFRQQIYVGLGGWRVTRCSEPGHVETLSKMRSEHEEQVLSLPPRAKQLPSHQSASQGPSSCSICSLSEGFHMFSYVLYCR